jgi:hypothetical protein
MGMANTLAYYNKTTIIAIKSIFSTSPYLCCRTTGGLEPQNSKLVFKCSTIVLRMLALTRACTIKLFKAVIVVLSKQARLFATATPVFKCSTIVACTTIKLFKTVIVAVL